jgi:hypothetical protein
LEEGQEKKMDPDTARGDDEVLPIGQEDHG